LKASVRIQPLLRAVLIVTWLICLDCAADEVERHGGGGGAASPAPTLVSTFSEASRELPDLKFREFFKLPNGPRGLEPTERLKSLAGRRVAIVGYMVRQDVPANDFFVLSPVPVSLGDQDESLADDLPASVVFVHFQAPGATPPVFLPGLLRVCGTLILGAQEESDGHVSSVRLQLDAETSQALAARRTTPAIE